MKKDTAIKFLEDNNDALVLLGEKIKRAKMEATKENIDTVIATEKLIGEWLQEIFNITTEQVAGLAENDDDNLYLRLKPQEETGRAS
jgi:3'-phosphoadenosine 5'-phosphosulfate sulfotransferase